MKFILLIICAALFASCSKKDLYDNLQYSHMRYCERLKATQYDDCVRQYNSSYEEYTQQRAGTLHP